MDKQKAYSTHEIAKAKNASYYFLRGIGTALTAIHYSTFYYAEIYTSILTLLIVLCKPSQDSLAVHACQKLNCVLASQYRNLVRELQ